MLDQPVIMQPEAVESDTLLGTVFKKTLGHYRIDVGDRELTQYFPEFRQFAGLCRFGASCSHNHEPDCAIKAAVEDGQISVRRHQSYLRLKG